MKSFRESKLDHLINVKYLPEPEWDVLFLASEECLSYVAINTLNQEALLVDPKDEMGDFGKKILAEWKGYTWLGVVDTHTHADHISAAPLFAQTLGVPLFMHHLSPSRRVHLRVANDTLLPNRSGVLRILLTPGHTPDSLCVEWGPFVFTGDTVLFGDVGRDDLPGGDPTAHFASLEKLKRVLKPEALIFPGHDCKGGRFSSWAHQLQANSSLTQDRESYIVEATAFDGPPPQLLKKSLFENFK